MVQSSRYGTNCPIQAHQMVPSLERKLAQLVSLGDKYHRSSNIFQSTPFAPSLGLSAEKCCCVKVGALSKALVEKARQGVRFPSPLDSQGQD